MSSGEDQPYNSLGQIIAAGGEIALGLAIAYGWSDRQISLLFARRFEPMTPDDRRRLTDIAEASVNAARELNESGPSAGIGLGDVPIIPGLFGESPEGLRFKVIGEFQFDEGGKWYSARLDFPDVPTWQEMIAAIEAYAMNVSHRSPDRFGVDPDDPSQVNATRLTFVGRGF